jgi:NifU-like protein involved in Fe-S cluster formation
VVRDAPDWGRVRRAAYRTYGCPAAVACGSMTAQLATGRSVETLLELNARDIALLVGGLPRGKEHCADLAVRALRAAFSPYNGMGTGG